MILTKIKTAILVCALASAAANAQAGLAPYEVKTSGIRDNAGLLKKSV